MKNSCHSGCAIHANAPEPPTGSNAMSTQTQRAGRAGRAALTLALATAFQGASAHAASNAELEQRIAELEQTVRLLSRKLEVADEVYQNDKAKVATNGRVKAGLDGFSLVSPDGQAELKLKALVQFDGRAGIEDYKDADTWSFRRVRPTIEARLGRASLRFTPEFAEDDADLVDGYVDWALTPTLSLRAGQFKPSISLERAQAAGSLVFTERTFPTELAPNRDRGVMLYANLLDRRLNLEFGLTNGTPDGRNGTNSDVDGEQELNARAFFEFRPGIGVGVSGTRGEKIAGNDLRAASASNSNAFLPRYRSASQTQIFGYRNGTAADGDHTRFSPHAYAYVGPFGLMAEYISSEQEISLNAQHGSFRNEALQFTGVWAITGEDEGFKGIKPAGPDGAWEIALRYALLDTDDDAFDQGFADPAAAVTEAEQFAIGLNWTITPNLKAFTDYSLTHFDGGAAGGADRDDEKVLFTRLQLNY
jgi:phosphate-selective porin OprO/OprP